ncbi:hypothetical protein [Aliikangiella sp. IMCC44359]|uniref:hypothetical protein n=1 Tax=Aliikangiella sp. IMCC44359 TaxID=3459125 RepID=UPI00403B06A7
MIYNLISAYNYREFTYNEAQINNIFGALSEGNIDKRIDMSSIPQSYKGIINEPLIFDFSPTEKSQEKLSIPDLSVREGRLFLTDKAYDVLEPLIKNDGEFLSVTYENKIGYFFIPLRVVDVDLKITMKNEWDEITNLGFIEEDTKEYNIFRTEYDVYYRLYCQEAVKEVIENAGLTGLYITTDLATIYPHDRSEVDKLN